MAIVDRPLSQHHLYRINVNVGRRTCDMAIEATIQAVVCANLIHAN